MRSTTYPNGKVHSPLTDSGDDLHGDRDGRCGRGHDDDRGVLLDVEWAGVEVPPVALRGDERYVYGHQL